MPRVEPSPWPGPAGRPDTKSWQVSTCQGGGEISGIAAGTRQRSNYSWTRSMLSAAAHAHAQIRKQCSYWDRVAGTEDSSHNLLPLWPYWQQRTRETLCPWTLTVTRHSRPSRPTLVLFPGMRKPDLGQQSLVQTDASVVGLGPVLTQSNHVVEQSIGAVPEPQGCASFTFVWETNPLFSHTSLPFCGRLFLLLWCVSVLL